MLIVIQCNISICNVAQNKFYIVLYYICREGNFPICTLKIEHMFSHKNPMTNKVWTRDELYNSLQEMRRDRDNLLQSLPSTNVLDDSIINTDVLQRKISEANSKIGTLIRQLGNRSLQLAAKRAVR